MILLYCFSFSRFPRAYPLKHFYAYVLKIVRKENACRDFVDVFKCM